MRTLSPDTSPEAEAALVRLARDFPPARKLEIAAALSSVVRGLTLAGIRLRHPGSSEDEERRHLAEILLPAELAALVGGGSPRET
jgi:hypothetical protein